MSIFKLSDLPFNSKNLQINNKSISREQVLFKKSYLLL